MSTLEQLRQFTTIVSDTADFEKLGHYRPRDNPSHILNAVKLQKYTHTISAAASYGISQSQDLETRVQYAKLHLMESFGVEILKRTAGRASTEVDSTYSFDRDRTIAMPRDVVGLYEKFGVCRDRVLIKIAPTAGLPVFSRDGLHELKDPGVQLVTNIFHHYKSLDIKTQIMAASLRNIDVCVDLASVDLMTLNVRLLKELKNADYEVKARLLVANGETGAHKASPEYLLDEAKFSIDLFMDVMATEKINESLRIFLNDGEELKNLL
ncbi:uncharacterized protein Z519_11111 [Cladophialophora bantiana CBS 173.52]|uniref:Uncharacterized protein n=1 Tax=Cladophialophora bantiana (strain ATCC 10958 / CBS 173.52 / CDC B-1940 / NIH 8579) TaxID=1442370 RepID=A0A0D2ED40_CLAB1|nr:uncharacterized protein Z519_11111 [Cladophialophora bantiana CBS 173.52]KIW88001.1 hypothetical protein Z519_11111 [Cladophialophora bantiana CBS 173.52]